MSDSFLYESSLTPEEKASIMLSKEVLYVVDQNSGSYTGQIQIDTSSLANNGKWASYSDAYLEVPFIMSMKSSTDITGASYNGFMAGLKAGNHQLINSIQVDLNNTNILQPQSYTNFYCTYRAMTSWSKDDLQKYGSITGIIPDTAASGQFFLGASAGGNGFVNNFVASPPGVTPIIWTTTSGDGSNAGFLERMKRSSYPLTTAVTGYGLGPIPSITTVSQAQMVAKNYFTDDGGAAAARVYSWVMTLNIRLKDLSDYFEQVPLMRGAFYRFIINYNSCQSVVTSVAAGPTMIQAAPTMYSGLTNPMMVASSLVANPMNLIVAGGSAGVFTFQCGIKTTPQSAVSGPLSAVRLYVPCYTIAPALEDQLLKLAGDKRIVYEDVYQYTVSSIAAGGSFNQILTNGLANLQKLVIMPVYNSVAGNAATIALAPYQSCFDSCPGTTSPLCALTQFQVQLSGANVFQQNEQYDFEQFLNELSKDGAVNGGESTGITSGLISRHDFDNCYRYYVADLSRRLPAEDKIAKSVSVLGINDTSKVLDLYAFLVYRRSIVVKLSTGQIVGT